MNDKYKMKKLFVLVFALIVTISGFFEFVYIPAIDLSMATFNVKGFTAVIFGAYIYYYSIVTKKKIPLYISILLVFFGYLYNFYTISKNDAALLLFGVGCYMYYISSIPFIISLFFPIKLDPEYEENLVTNNIQEQKNNLQNVEGDYLLGSYISGFKERNIEFKSPTIFISKANINDLFVNIKNSDEIIIDYNSIEKIIISKSTIVNFKNEKPQDYSMETEYLALMLAGPYGGLLALGLPQKKASSKVNLNNYYKIEIFYKEINEDKRVVFQTYEEPYQFFDKYKDKLEIK